MPIGSGLATQLGGKKETTYGTRVVPDKFYEYLTEGFARQQNYLESRQLRAGRFFQSSSRRALTTRSANGTVTGEVPNKNFGFFLDLLHGNAVTPVQQGATAAYLQTHDLTGDPSKSATIQVGKPDTGGVVRPYDYLGAMVTSAGFACAVGEFLTFNFDFDAQDEDTAQTLASAVYPTALESFHFQQAVVTVNSVVQNNVTGFSLDLGMPRADDRFYLRSSALKAKPILNDYSGGTGTLTFEFSDMTQYGLFTAGTKVPLSIAFTGSLIAGAFSYGITFTSTAVQFTGTTPVVDGPDLLSFDAPFVILDDGTNAPLRVTYMDVVTTAL